MRKNGSQERFQIPKYKAQSGGKLTQDFVDELIADVRSQGHGRQPQVITLLNLILNPSFFTSRTTP